ncbi:DUF547 domain-containing protein [Vicingaceae bacterium]|nr:DUF547 domain-containing protein [Vicingaceae bacterium]
MKSITTALIFLLCSLVSFAGVGEPKLDHSSWDRLLQKHVTAQGNVNYEGFKKDLVALDAYLNSLSATNPDANWTRSEAMSYWINAYNAYTIKLMLNNYPLKSIMNVNGGKAWDLKFINIKGEKYSLNNIEHDILREKFFDPRIHFAVNCASISCPKLSNTAYFAEGLDGKLDKAAKEFINNSSKNNITADKAQISKLFDWYKDDFTKNGTVKDYLNKYSTTKFTSNNISFKEYNWNINK